MPKLRLLLLFLFPAAFLSAETELWRKTISEFGTDGRWRVGTDGSVAIIGFGDPSGSTSIHWIGRDGSVVAEVSSAFPVVREAKYVSSDELVLEAKTADNETRLELFQFNGQGGLDIRAVAARGDPIAMDRPLSYPYLLSAEVIATNEDGVHDYEFVLYDLTNENTLEIIGDAVTGVIRSNLNVLWKTIANAKYKVQISHDGVNWTDYTEIIDGNGSMMRVSIPLNEHGDDILARVVKL